MTPDPSDTPDPGIDDRPRQDAPPARVFENVFCIQCGYDLIGLRPEGVCPECGETIEESLRGNLLVHRSRDYVRSLRRGLSFILNGLLLWFIFNVLVGPGVGFFYSARAASSGGLSFSGLGAVQSGIAVLDLAVSGLILYGWWLFTTRDPADPVRDGAPTARRVARSAVIAQAAFKLVAAALSIALAVMPGGLASVMPAHGVTAPPAPSPTFWVLSLASSAAGFGALAAFAAQFFAGMLYVRSLAPRLPDAKIHRLAKTRMIACPIWATVGSLILIGPLIALILYWNLLNMVRKRLKRILAEQGGPTAS